MDTIISKYDFINATEEIQQALQTELYNASILEFAKHLDLSGMKNIINIFVKKICVKDYVINQPRFSPGTWMATSTIGCISTLFSACVENGKVSQSDCQDCLFNLLLAILRSGPGTSHYEVLDKLYGTLNLRDYLKKLKGEKLKELVLAVQNIKYIPEKDRTLEDYCSLMNSYMSSIVKVFIEGRDDYKETDIWSAFLDVYLFFLLYSSQTPNELHFSLSNCTNVVWYRYDRNPYKNFPDHTLTRKHVQKITELVTSPEFPRGKQLEMAAEFIQELCFMKENQLEAVFDDMLKLFKVLCLSEKANKLTKIIEAFRLLFTDFSAPTIEKNHTLFETWATVVCEVLEKMQEKVLLENAVPKMISDITKVYQPVKGDEKYWFTLIKAVLTVPTKEMQYSVRNVVQEKKLKRMWEWKENIQEAKMIVKIVEKLNLPTVGERRDETNSNCGDAIKELIETLEILKIEHQIMAEIGQMTLTHMEKKSILANSMVDRYISKVNFQKVPEVIPELIKRFEPLIKDIRDYPWHDNWSSSNGYTLIGKIIAAYKTGSDIPDDVNQTLIRIFDFCIEEEREHINIENGQQTVWGKMFHNLFQFIHKHSTGKTVHKCRAVLERLVKLRHSDEKFIKDVVRGSVEVVGSLSPEVLFGLFEELLDWYIEEPQMQLLHVFYQIVDKSNKLDPLKNRWEKFFEVAMAQSDSFPSQSSLFLKMSEKVPMLFTDVVVDGLMDNHFKVQTIRIPILMVIMNITKVNHSVFVKHMDMLLTDKIAPVEQYSVNGILVNVAMGDKKFKDRVFSYFMDILKTATDSNQVMHTIPRLQDLCVKYGPDMFGPHKDYIIKRKENEQNSHILTQLNALIDQIEGRSLESVAQDVTETKEDVSNLDTRVTGTETAVGTLTSRVDQHDDAIQEQGQGLDTVTQRVDFAEKDIAETKIKVEEIDNKTMTNAPRWSRDLTKLMNPADEHDWRLLAQRLGYSNDDIRAWATQHDPCMAVLSEWYATHKTREATHAVLTALQEMDRIDGAAIVENAMKAAEDVVEDEEIDYPSPPPVFLSYQWGHQDEVKLIRNHLQMAGYECWMDIGQMGGGDKLFEKIDNGIRGAKILICCVSEKYAKSPNCNREVNLAVSLGKPMIPLLMEQMSWPPKGSMGPIFSEYLFVRFFQRPGEETKDHRFWPVAKFQETLMQLNCYGILPDESMIDEMYKNWWIPVQEIIVIDKSKQKVNQSQAKQKEESKESKKSPDVFLSYQWGKQKQIMALYQRLTGLGLSCWMDIYQMGGGDSLYEKIDSGVRGCKVVLTCITQKYSLSANCRREVSLADALQKPIIPLLLEKMDWPPSGPMSMVFTQLLFINFYRDEEVQTSWTGPKFNELLDKIGEQIPMITQKENPNGIAAEQQKIDSAKNQEVKLKKPVTKETQGQQQESIEKSKHYSSFKEMGKKGDNLHKDNKLVETKKSSTCILL